MLHLPDGPEQHARDVAMRAAMAAVIEGKPFPAHGNPNLWADRERSRALFSYDAYAEVERWWANWGRVQIEKLAAHPETETPLMARLNAERTRLH